MNDSLLAACTAVDRQPVRAEPSDGTAPITMSKPAGRDALLLALQPRAARDERRLPWHQAACASVCDSASEPLMR